MPELIPIVWFHSMIQLIACSHNHYHTICRERKREREREIHAHHACVHRSVAATRDRRGGSGMLGVACGVRRRRGRPQHRGGRCAHLGGGPRVAAPPHVPRVLPRSQSPGLGKPRDGSLLWAAAPGWAGPPLRVARGRLSWRPVEHPPVCPPPRPPTCSSVDIMPRHRCLHTSNKIAVSSSSHRVAHDACI